MLTITQEKYNAIPKDYKGTFADYRNEAPQLKGRRTWLTKDESGPVLLLEGVHFLVEGDFSHLPALTKETAADGHQYDAEQKIPSGDFDTVTQQGYQVQFLFMLFF